jgi:hypothetical protein
MKKGPNFAASRIALAGISIAAAEVFLYFMGLRAPGIFFFGPLIACGLAGIVFFSKTKLEMIAGLTAVITASGVGVVTLDPCTGAPFFFAMPAGIITYYVVQAVGRNAAANKSLNPTRRTASTGDGKLDPRRAG